MLTKLNQLKLIIFQTRWYELILSYIYYLILVLIEFVLGLFIPYVGVKLSSDGWVQNITDALSIHNDQNYIKI